MSHKGVWVQTSITQSNRNAALYGPRAAPKGHPNYLNGIAGLYGSSAAPKGRPNDSNRF